MEIMELAIKLGQLIKVDDRVKRMEEAKIEYENSGDLQNKMLEYNVQQTALTEEYKKELHDEEIISAIKSRINTLYHDITESEIYVNYSETQEEVNQLMTEVNGEITFQITGERPCEHNCSSCGGCH